MIGCYMAWYINLKPFSYIILKSDQTCFKNFAVYTLKDFYSIFDHSSTSYMKWLNSDI